MAAKASEDGFVAILEAPETIASLRDRLKAMAEVVDVPGHSDVARVVCHADAKSRPSLGALRAAAGKGVRIEPVLLDENGEPCLPTGRIGVRFTGEPTDPELEAFAKRHGLRLEQRNAYIRAQASFRVRPDAEQTISELTSEIEGDERVRKSWPDTLRSFRRRGSA